MIGLLSSSIIFFTTLIIILVISILIAEKKLINQEKVELLINNDKKVKVMPGNTLLNTLSAMNIFIPSACGGGGTCAMCKCKISSGGGEILPTEKMHINRKEEKENVRLACQVKVRNAMDIHVPDEIFSIKQFTGTVTSNDNVATFIKDIRWDIDNNEELKFQAGGYVQISVPAGKYPFKDFNIPKQYRDDWDKFDLWRYTCNVEEPMYRAYSMANHPAEGNKVSLTIRIATPPPNKPDVNPGQCSSYIFSLKPGDKINFSGPYGEFFIKESKREMIYIGGGAGMAPMRSHVFHLFHTLKTTRKVSFFYGARSKRESFFDQDFLDIENKFPNFKYTLALSEPLPEDKWNGATGFINQVVYEKYLKSHEDPSEIEYYLCGPPMMIDAVVNMLEDLGVEEDMISYDKF